METISWFFFDLLLLGYVEDSHSGESFQLPGGLFWSIYVEVSEFVYHYYRIHGRFVLPVRWMSIECFYGKFSQKSDVWAFGVTMWEIFTLAKKQPYNDMSDKQVVESALKGKNRKILAKPDMCPIKVYIIMLKCWEHSSDQRATFDKLLQLLTSIHSNIHGNL